MKYIFVLISIFVSGLFMGCASQPIPMEPSIYLLSTNKEPISFLNEIADELKANRYEVESLDLNVGLLIMQPRRFVILRGDERTYAQQAFQIRQEGGSVKVRITYLCEYAKGSTDCDEKDKFARSKIRKIERLIMAMINRKLFKKPGVDRAKSREI